MVAADVVFQKTRYCEATRGLRCRVLGPGSLCGVLFAEFVRTACDGGEDIEKAPAGACTAQRERAACFP